MGEKYFHVQIRKLNFLAATIQSKKWVRSTLGHENACIFTILGILFVRILEPQGPK